MDNSKLKAIIVSAVTTFGALYLGIAAATAQFELVLWVVGIMSLAICIALGRRVWMLIPLASSLGLVLPFQGNFSTEFIAQLLTLGFCSLLFLMRRLPMRLRFTELELWNLLFIACVVQVYARNPVGLNILGGDSVGAKPYVLFAVTSASALLLSFLLVTPQDLRWWVRLSLLGSVLNFSFGALGKLFPALGYYLGASYTTVEDSGDEESASGANRIGFVREISTALALWISSRISPIRACFHPLWLPLVLASFAAAAYSGFRSQLILVGLHFFVGVCYRSGWRGVIISTFAGCVSLSLLAFVNLIAPLPANVQRSLTFLPGTWEERFKQDAQGSTDWRVEMWKEALFSDRWIQNKWLGDGLGFTKSELQRMAILNEQKGQSGISGMSAGQETMMISGGYHSGPVSTIRTVGYIGLAILLVGMCRLVVHAHRQIKRCRNTEWLPVALFLCIPIIASPIFWVFVYGSFTGGGQILLMGSALVALLERNLPLPAYTTKQGTSYNLKPHRDY